MPRVRKTYLLVETASGERQLVKSMTGCEGCKVIAKRVREPPSPFHRLTAKGKWKEDKAAAERARINRMSKAELLEEAMRRLARK